MRKALFLLFFVCCWGIVSGQHDWHRVIVVMNEQYDNIELGRKTQFMDKAQRREFAINDHKTFCEASQAEVMEIGRASCRERVLW